MKLQNLVPVNWNQIFYAYALKWTKSNDVLIICSSGNLGKEVEHELQQIIAGKHALLKWHGRVLPLGSATSSTLFCDSDSINSTHKDRQPYRAWMDVGISSTYEWLQYLWDTLQINKTLVLSAEWLNWALKWPTNHPWVNAVKVLWPQNHGRVCQRKNTYFLTYLKFMFNLNVYLM